jgi:nucleotide-binding universal stress UspA family protein
MNTASNQRGHRFVVGVDGSQPSKSALAWAVRQAKLTGATVEPVIAWEFPATYGYPVPAPPAVSYEEIAGEVLDLAIAGAGPDGQVPVEPKVVEGNPAWVLLKAAEGAGLLVVGNRGHGGFVGALLGSVGQHCVQHATCPVVVMRDSAGD